LVYFIVLLLTLINLKHMFIVTWSSTRRNQSPTWKAAKQSTPHASTPGAYACCLERPYW
jgi:hypothetical protein